MPTLTQREAKQLKKQENLSKKSSKRLPTLAAQENYVFLPQYHSNRDYALKQLQRQFDILLWSTGLRNNVQGEDRSLYSLRHTCIMYRLMYGEGKDLLTLARNARTSPEMIDRFYASHLTTQQTRKQLYAFPEAEEKARIASAKKVAKKSSPAPKPPKVTTKPIKSATKTTKTRTGSTRTSSKSVR